MECLGFEPGAAGFVAADETTELWRQPIVLKLFKTRLDFNFRVQSSSCSRMIQHSSHKLLQATGLPESKGTLTRMENSSKQLHKVRS